MNDWIKRSCVTIYDTLHWQYLFSLLGAVYTFSHISRCIFNKYWMEMQSFIVRCLVFWQYFFAISSLFPLFNVIDNNQKKAFHIAIVCSTIQHIFLSFSFHDFLVPIYFWIFIVDKSFLSMNSLLVSPFQWNAWQIQTNCLFYPLESVNQQYDTWLVLIIFSHVCTKVQRTLIISHTIAS